MCVYLPLKAKEGQNFCLLWDSQVLLLLALLDSSPSSAVAVLFVCVPCN